MLTGVACPQCRVRFGAAAAASLSACPICERPLQGVARREDLIGHRLFVEVESADPMPEAIAVAIPVPDP